MKLEVIHAFREFLKEAGETGSWSDSQLEAVLKAAPVNLAARGRVMIDEKTWLDNWHDKDSEGNLYVRYGITVSRPLPTEDPTVSTDTTAAPVKDFGSPAVDSDLVAPPATTTEEPAKAAPEPPYGVKYINCALAKMAECHSLMCSMEPQLDHPRVKRLAARKVYKMAKLMHRMKAVAHDTYPEHFEAPGDAPTAPAGSTARKEATSSLTTLDVQSLVREVLSSWTPPAPVLTVVPVTPPAPAIPNTETLKALRALSDTVSSLQAANAATRNHLFEITGKSN